MEDKIKEVHDYFKNKIVIGDYVVHNVGEYTIVIIVDGKYRFTLWTANEAQNLKTYSDPPCYMQLTFSLDEQESIFAYLQRIRAADDETRALEIRQAKMRQLEDLKKQLGIE